MPRFIQIKGESAATEESARKQEESDKGITLCLLLVITIVVGIRTPALWQVPLWIDEAYTLKETETGFHAMMAWMHHVVHPPLSYLLVAFSRSVFQSDSEWVLRLPSYIAWLFCLPSAYHFGGRIHSHRAGLWLALAVSVHPFIATQGVQARMWTLSLLMSLLTMDWTVRLLDGKRSAIDWGIMGLLWAGGLWASQAGLILLIATLTSIALQLSLKSDKETLPAGMRWFGVWWALLVTSVLCQMGIVREFSNRILIGGVSDHDPYPYKESFFGGLLELISQPGLFLPIPHFAIVLVPLGIAGLFMCLRLHRTAGIVTLAVLLVNVVGLSLIHI